MILVMTYNKNDILEAIYERYKFLMYHISFEILHDNALAEDCVQTVFLKLSRLDFSIDHVDSNKTKSFVIIVTRNIALNLYNKRKKENIVYVDEQMNSLPDKGLQPSEIVLNKIDLNNVANELKKMDVKYSDIVILKYFYNLNYKEISILLGISEQLIRVRLHRAKKALVNKMMEDNSNECN